eukprot:IDg3373t1
MRVEGVGAGIRAPYESMFRRREIVAWHCLDPFCKSSGRNIPQDEERRAANGAPDHCEHVRRAMLIAAAPSTRCRRSAKPVSVDDAVRLGSKRRRGSRARALDAQRRCSISCCCTTTAHSSELPRANQGGARCILRRRSGLGFCASLVHPRCRTTKETTTTTCRGVRVRVRL